MIVTFNLKFRALIKNSWMFVILGFWRNLAVGLSSVAMLALFILFPLFYPAAMPFFQMCIRDSMNTDYHGGRMTCSI